MISGGFAGGGESNSTRKAHLRSIRLREVLEVQAMYKLPRLDTAITFSDSDLEGCQHPHDDPLVIRAVVANKIIHRVLVDNGSSTTITFSDSDLEGCQHPHDDPLVIRAVVANKIIHRVLVDNGSSTDIIFALAFDKMGIGRERLEPVNTHL